jgi:hypothetical protein
LAPPADGSFASAPFFGALSAKLLVSKLFADGLRGTALSSTFGLPPAYRKLTSATVFPDLQSLKSPRRGTSA